MSRRRLSSDERALWKHVTRSIAPLRTRHPDEPEEQASDSSISGRRAAPADRALSESGKPAPQSTGKARSRAKDENRAPATLAPLGRRFKQRLKRGTDSIDSRVDLHGLTQAEAHAALLQFLRRSQADGARNVLVITGKGGGADAYSGRGVLKRQVPLWLQQPEFRAFVVGLEGASVAHGGEGALYVRLRRSP
jgi:DNA-nicking Smr family endonuclease